MRVTFHVSDEVGKEMEKLAKDKGVSVPSSYAEVIGAHIKERRKRAKRTNRLIGNTYVAPDFREQLADMRKASDRDLK